MRKTSIITTSSFDDACYQLTYLLKKHSTVVAPMKWQGRNVTDKPEMATRELQHVHVHVYTHKVEGWNNLAHWRRDIKPNLPWADDHFLERVGGKPLNPGETWRYWPFNKSAETFLDSSGQFNHSYMERFWPRFANCKTPIPNVGIRFEYGDLADVVELLKRDPLTRQAYLPIFFPEDTGVGDGSRKPCTLGYHFMIRGGQLDIYYPMRSCDFVRHFRDDCYLAIRLGLWVIEKLGHPELRLGCYSMFMSSLHIFMNDLRE